MDPAPPVETPPEEVGNVPEEGQRHQHEGHPLNMFILTIPSPSQYLVVGDLLLLPVFVVGHLGVVDGHVVRIFNQAEVAGVFLPSPTKLSRCPAFEGRAHISLKQNVEILWVPRVARTLLLQERRKTC